MAGKSDETAPNGGLYGGFISAILFLFLGVIYAGYEAGVWWLAVILFFVYVLASIRVMQAHQIGGIVGLGYPLKIASVGVNFVPLGLMQLVTVPRAPHQKQFPEEPELVFQGSDTEPLPIRADGRQQVRPIRIITGKPRPTPPGENPEAEEAETVMAGKFKVGTDGNGQDIEEDIVIKKYYDGPLNIQITVKMTGTARYMIVPDQFFDFWTQLPGDTAEEKLDDIDRQLQDTFVDVCKRQWQMRPFGMVIDDDKAIEDSIFKVLQKEIEGQKWGIRLMEINLYPPDAGQHLNEELGRIGQEKARKEQAIAKADGALYTTEKEALGRLATEKADTDAAAHRAEKLGMTGREVIGLETANAMLNNKDKFFFGADGIAQAVATGSTILDALRDNGGAPKEVTPKDSPQEGGTQ